jgi:hypothetical protein
VNKERMGKFEGGEERLKKDFASPILEFETERWYINFIIKKILCIYTL